MTSPARTSRRTALTPLGVQRSAADMLLEARALERAGCAVEAMDVCEQIIDAANRGGDRAAMPEALRRLAVLCHRRGDAMRARELCHRSREVASMLDNALAEAEAFNSLGCMDLEAGTLDGARQNFMRAVFLGSSSQELCARVEQNLGVLANIQGDFQEALTRYGRSLDAWRACNNEHGCAIAYHNLGLVSADRELWDDAVKYFEQSLEIAERAGDVPLRAGCLVGKAKAELTRQRFDDARQSAELALALFDQLGAKGEKSGAYRVIGVVYRETGRSALAESRLRSAIEIAVSANSVLGEAEASRDLALLYQGMGRNQEALELLNAAHALFGQLDARRDLVNVASRVVALEETYLAVVREWGQSIESSDSYTYGHCERVAGNAMAVARALGLSAHEQTTIRLGAYLHDLGKVKVPHEILNKPGPLTQDEFEVIQMHPAWGIELLSEIEFPWDIKPIIRWHHEKYDGTGYPDRLRGEEIPVAAQIVGIVDVYDALTTTRAYRGAMPHDKAIEVITRSRSHWAPEVFDAFIGAVGSPTTAKAPGARAQQAAWS